MAANYTPTVQDIINEAVNICGKKGSATAVTGIMEFDQANIYLKRAIQRACSERDWQFNRTTTKVAILNTLKNLEHGIDDGFYNCAKLPDTIMRVTRVRHENGDEIKSISMSTTDLLWVSGHSTGNVWVSGLNDVSLVNDSYLTKIGTDREEFVRYAGALLASFIVNPIHNSAQMRTAVEVGYITPLVGVLNTKTISDMRRRTPNKTFT